VRGVERVPLWVAIFALCAVLVSGIYLSFRWQSVGVLLATLAVVAVLAGLYLYDYSRRPLERPTPARGTASAMDRAMGEEVPGVDDDPEFADPVIEADRISAGEVLPDVVEEEESPSPSEPEVGP
jgi:hypothetical protein